MKDGKRKGKELREITKERKRKVKQRTNEKKRKITKKKEGGNE